MYRIARAAVFACASGMFLLSGCASIVSGTNQPLTVMTTDCAGAVCNLTNSKGTWVVTAPGSVVVHRAYGDMTVDCTKEGAMPGTATVRSTTKGMAFGNILFGGVIGAGVDIGTGAAYDYPNTIAVTMSCAAPANKS